MRLFPFLFEPPMRANVIESDRNISSQRSAVRANVGSKKLALWISAL